MADTNTTNLVLVKPEVGASTDTWGTKLNSDLDIVDGLFNSTPALLVTKGGTGASTAAGARTNLGCGTIATQDANAVSITGGLVATTNVGGCLIDNSPIGATLPRDAKFTTVAFPDGTIMATASTLYAATVVTKTASAVLTAGQSRQLCKADATAGSITITLPTAVGIAGNVFDVKKVDATANTVTIAFTGGQTADGIATQVIYTQWDSYTFQSDGANWMIT